METNALKSLLINLKAYYLVITMNYLLILAKKKKKKRGQIHVWYVVMGGGKYEPTAGC